MAAKLQAWAFAQSERIIKAALKESPNSHVFWVRFAFLRGLILSGEKIGEIYCTSPPHSKAFEYLQAGKPIFAIAPEGESAGNARQRGFGIAVQPGSVTGAAEALRNLIAVHATGDLARVPNESFIRSFERAFLTERLTDVLDKVKEAQLVRPCCASR
jgi:hypothetical protein